MEVPIDDRLPLSSSGRPIPPTMLHPHHLHVQMCGDVTVHHKLDLNTYKPHVFHLPLPRDGLTYAVNTLHVWVDNRVSSSSCKPTVTLPCPTERPPPSKLPLKSFAYEPLRANIGAYVSIRERHDRGICGVLRKVKYDERFDSISVVVEDLYNRPGTFGLYSLETEFEVEIEITPVVNDGDEGDGDNADGYYDGKEPQTCNVARNVVLDTAASQRYRLANGTMNSCSGSASANVDHSAGEDDIDAPYASILVHGIGENVDPSDYGTLYAMYQVSTPTKRPTGQAFDVMYHLSVPGREPPSTTHAKRPGHLEVYAQFENPLAGTVDLLENVTITFQITAQDVGSAIALTHVYESDRRINEGDMLHLSRAALGSNEKPSKNSNTANTMELELAAAAGNGRGRRGNSNDNNNDNNSKKYNNGAAISSSLTSWADPNSAVDLIDVSSVAASRNKTNPNTHSDTYPEFKANLTMPEDIILRTAHPVTLRGRRSQRLFLFEDAVELQLFHMYAVNPSRGQSFGSVKVYAHVWRHEKEVLVPGIVNMCFPDVSGRNMKGIMDRSGFVNLEWKFPALVTFRASQDLCVVVEQECELVGGEEGSGYGGRDRGEEVGRDLAELEDGMQQGLEEDIQHMPGRTKISSGRPVPPPVSIFEGILTKYLPQKEIFSVFLRNEGDESQYIGIPFMRNCHDKLFRSMHAMRYASFDAAAAAMSDLPSTSFSHPSNTTRPRNSRLSSQTRTRHPRNHSLSALHTRNTRMRTTHSTPPQALDILERRIGLRDHVVFTQVDAHDECVVVITIRLWTEFVVDVETMNMHEIEQLALWDDVSEDFIARLYKMHDAREHADDINRMQNAALERCIATRDACVDVAKQVGVSMGVQYDGGVDNDDYGTNGDVRLELMRQREKIRRMCDVVDDAVTHHSHLVKQAWRSATAAEKIRLQMYNVPYEQIANDTSTDLDSIGGMRISRGRSRTVRRLRSWPNEYKLDDNEEVDDGGEDIGNGDNREQILGVDENDENTGAARGVDVELMHYRSVLSRKNVRH